MAEQESKHTPGPWRIALGSHDLIYAGATLVAQADCGLFSESNVPRVDEVSANARLISAAPELLEALKEARLQIDYLHGKFKETGSGNSVLSTIDAAIAKAEGEA